MAPLPKSTVTELDDDQGKQGTTDTTKANNHKVLSVLTDEVQCLVGETSEKYVPQPTRDEVIQDAINGLRRFKDGIRWKEFHRLQQQEKQKNKGIEPTEEDIETFNEQMNDKEEGLKTGLRPTKINLSAPRGSEKLEEFLKAVEEEILKQAFEYKGTKHLGP